MRREGVPKVHPRRMLHLKFRVPPRHLDRAGQRGNRRHAGRRGSSAIRRARTRWATSRACADCVLPNLARARPGQHQAAGGHSAGRRSARGLRPLRAGLAGQGHHHRPLGNGRHSSGPAVSALPARIPAARSWTNSSGASAAARWATRPPPAPRSSRNWAPSTCAPARRSSTPRPTASFRWPRTKK